MKHEIHEKIIRSSCFLTKRFPFYSEIFLSCNITDLPNESEMPTAGVRVTRKGFELAYNTKFIESQNDKQVNFILVHEMLHLINNHQSRTIMWGLNHRKANEVGDRIINSYITTLGDDFEYPNVGAKLLVPKEYEGPHVLEDLYKWMEDNGKFGDVDNWDNHDLLDEVSPEVKQRMVEDIVERAKARGLVSGHVEGILKSLQKPTHNYLKEIKSNLAQMSGTTKQTTWAKFSRKSDLTKGYKKHKIAFNVILDTSGSMGNEFEKVLSYIFYNGIEVNLIQCDTQVQSVSKVKNKGQIQRISTKGHGGTIIQPALDLVVEKFNSYPTILLTDGYTDTLHTSALKKKFMVLTTDTFCPIQGKEVKQFKVN